MAMKSLTLALALSVAALAALAGNDALESRSGYVDLRALGAAYGEPRVSIDLGSSLLRLVGAAAEHEDPLAGETLRKLESFRVQVYDTRGDSDAAANGMDDARQSLVAQSWEQVVRVHEPDNRVEIYVKQDAELIHGLAIMAVDGQEAVFINILGEISPDELSMVMNEIDLDLDVDLDI
jgi:hypothetical protein